ncbi:MAG: ferredoxin [Acidobacteriota bacterium]|nr:ferredoxin [Acidobacteriota bacterium]
MPKVTVRVDPDVCITAANCVGIAPKLFHIGAEPYAELLNSEGQPQGNEYTFEATAAELELLEEAAESCPTRAISVTL